MESSKTPLTQQPGKLFQQFKAHNLMEPLICWKYHLKLPTALSDWVDATGFWVSTKGFYVNTSSELGQTMAAAGAALGRLCSPLASVPPALSLLFQRDGKLRPSWTTSASPASPSSPDHHISVPSVPLGCDKIPHVSPEIYVYTLLYIQRSPLITGMVTRQSVRGNKNRFPKLDIVNSVLRPSWFKTSTNCKYKSDTWRLLQVLLAL